MRVRGPSYADYILSDPVRRGEYDEARMASPPGGFDEKDSAQESANFFRSFFGTDSGRGAHTQPQPEAQFAEAWEDMLRPEVEQVSHLWRIAGSVSGGVMGFIIGNIPGALGGGLLGGKLGSIRDAKGKAVSEVFLNLRADQRTQILRELAMKFLGAL